jgi:uncharacterized SAM-binding protein YcdF (DUF218 family)
VPIQNQILRVQRTQRDRLQHSSPAPITGPWIVAPCGQSTLKRWGIFVRKNRWGLSWRGRLFLVCVLLLATSLLLKAVYPFLAVTHRVNSDVLVVEGWVHEYAIQAAVDEFRSGGYSRIFTTGGPVEGTGRYINDYNTSASVGADLLRKNGLASASVQMVPSRIVDHDRTYGSAVALQRWLTDHDIKVSGINVLTENVHARRSRLLFQKALGDSVRVGIIAVRNPDYEPKRWWSCSEGVRDVIGETVAYVYVKLFFHPFGGRAHFWKKSGNFASNSVGARSLWRCPLVTMFETPAKPPNGIRALIRKPSCKDSRLHRVPTQRASHRGDLDGNASLSPVVPGSATRQNRPEPSDVING